ncbi:MAG: GyrI-like domain-containing protein [Negativicutes bacterium]
MQRNWRKSEKEFYIPDTKPAIIEIPAYNYFVIEGKGNPNDEFFGEYVKALYSLSYAVKMAPKAGSEPKGYFEYTVYPLEGIWDISEDAKRNDPGTLDKESLVFQLMIRQPDFVTTDFAQEIIEKTNRKKPHELLSQVQFSVIADGLSIQMMHIGSYDSEPESFHIMHEFCTQKNLVRESMQHREIYLSDARKVAAEQLKTVLRFKVKKGIL